MQLTFRKIRASLEEWHFMRGCSEWPEADFAEQLATPPIAEICEKCIALSAAQFSAAEYRRERARRVGP
jgi:hypothetical protein